MTYDWILSVGVPVYNAENTLEKCLKSISLCKGFETYEIVCVDDGSTDASGYILDKWASEYNNIRVFHTDNKGAFLAREKIIEESRGKWIGFVDADDTISKSMYEDMLEADGDYNADIIVCAYKSNDIVHMNSFGNSCMDIRNNPDKMGCILAVNPAYWNKIFRKEIIKKAIKLNYSPRIMEDSLFFCSLIPYIGKIAFLDKPLYKYEKSCLGVTFSIGMQEIKEAESGIRDFLSGMLEHPDEYMDHLIKNFVCAYYSLHLGVAFSINSNEKDSLCYYVHIWRETRTFLDEVLPGWENNHYLNFRYVSRHKMITKLYVGYVLYKSVLWPVVVKWYKVFSKVTGKDLKW